MSSVNLVNLFNSYNHKRIITIKEMDENRDYVISGAYRTQTKYGERIVLKLDDAILYLPSRFLALREEDVKELGCGGYTISKSTMGGERDNTLYKLELKQKKSNFFYQPYLA